MATRQNSSSGNPKSPRVQVVLPEDLCSQLSELAKKESRTVSNMAKVLIQEGIKRFEEQSIRSSTEAKAITNKEKFISALESQQPRRLRGAPKRLRFFRSQ